ncbi:hypothetical protein ACFE04_024291 [Oxalis oulophora]
MLEEWSREKLVQERTESSRRLEAGDIGQPYGWIRKCDTTVFEGQNLSGFGMVITDSEGLFVKALAGHLPGITKPAMVEEFATRRRICWTKKNMTGKGSILLDAQTNVIALKSKSVDASKLRGVIEES